MMVKRLGNFGASDHAGHDGAGSQPAVARAATPGEATTLNYRGQAATIEGPSSCHAPLSPSSKLL
jgi:hypothetical protein